MRTGICGTGNAGDNYKMFRTKKISIIIFVISILSPVILYIWIISYALFLSKYNIEPIFNENRFGRDIYVRIFIWSIKISMLLNVLNYRFYISIFVIFHLKIGIISRKYIRKIIERTPYYVWTDIQPNINPSWWRKYT